MTLMEWATILGGVGWYGMGLWVLLRTIRADDAARDDAARSGG